MIGSAVKDNAMYKNIITHAVIAAAALYASSVKAEDTQIVAQGRSPETVTKIIAYGDLNLQIDAEVHQLKKRVWKASSEVCDELYDNRSQSHALERYACARKVYQGTSPQIADAVATSGNASMAASRASVKVVAVR
jgi:UrcA family protein